MRRLLAVYVVLIAIFLVLPQLVVVLVSFNATPRMVVDLAHLSLRWYRALAANPAFGHAFLTSFAIAPVVTLLAILLGGVAAYGAVRFPGRGRVWVEALLVAPLLLPATALAVAMFLFFYLLGLANTVTAVVIGHLVMAVPYAFRSIVAAIAGVDPRLEEAAMSLGASRLTAVRRTTLPLARDGIVAAALFCLIVSLDETTVTLFVGGRDVKTIPIEILNRTEYGMDPSVAAASSLMILVSAALIWLLARSIGLGKAYSLKK